MVSSAPRIHGGFSSHISEGLLQHSILTRHTMVVRGTLQLAIWKPVIKHHLIEGKAKELITASWISKTKVDYQWNCCCCFFLLSCTLTLFRQIFLLLSPRQTALLNWCCEINSLYGSQIEGLPMDDIRWMKDVHNSRPPQMSFACSSLCFKHCNT